MELNFREACTHTLSANEIRQYTECARKRYYSSRDHLALRTTKDKPTLHLGKAVHAMFQYYYTHAEKLGGLELVPRFQLKEEMDEDSCKVFNCIHENYMERLAEDVEKYSVIGCEVEFQLRNWPIDDVMYHGQIDMIVLDRETNKIWFFEHKTCKDFRPEIYNRFDIQLHIYTEYGMRYCAENGYEWGGIILNEVKKAKTERGYANHRMYYTYDDYEMCDFNYWLARKTAAAVDPGNPHEPCNNYMTCKNCEYSSICMSFGYQVPTDYHEITENEEFAGAFEYNPREEVEEDA